MRIFNIMLGRGLGGIEQAFVDYSACLARRGHAVVSVTRNGARILPTVSALKIPGHSVASLNCYGGWDIFCARALRKLLAEEPVDAIIAHGGRAVSMARRAAKGIAPVVGLAHNYSTRRLIGCDAIFTITQDLQQVVTSAGQPAERTFHIPNMVTEIVPTGGLHTVQQNPPVIGAMGRFVAKKGFTDFLEALKLLHAEGVPFRAILAGDGEERQRLKKRTAMLGLENVVEFPGWITDRAAFFRQCDVFCLPSHHEPFGIVLLEAMAHGVPVVTTDTEGPREIITPEEQALVVPIRDVHAMATALRQLMLDAAIGKKLAQNALKHVRAHYSPDSVGTLIEAALLETLKHTA
ncbi:MAG: glycosyltransferase [Hyphomicrobiales bacterium]|nr:glycosyltransferase [Hyphomicrobiales bacterium]